LFIRCAECYVEKKHKERYQIVDDKRRELASQRVYKRIAELVKEADEAVEPRIQEVQKYPVQNNQDGNVVISQAQLQALLAQANLSKQ